MKVTLTFDNGPERAVTPKILNILEREQILANFFVLGSKLALDHGRDLAAAARRAGHRIGNHTYWHETPLGEQDAAAALDEIVKTEALIGELKGDAPMFRPFGRGGQIGPHLINRPVCDHLVANGYTLALWNSVPQDWADQDGWVARGVDQCRAQPWSVVVLHDLPVGAASHLSEFIRRLRDFGATFEQDLPESCTPIRAGAITADVAGLMPAAT